MEPDPRVDLSGCDVARKLVILARQFGQRLSLGNIRVESMLPAALQKLDQSAFEARLAEYDRAWHQRWLKASQEGARLHYLASLDNRGQASAGLRTIPKDHPLANARAGDNIISIRTHRYDRNPIIIQGPGAGIEVTAAGVFADLIRLLDHYRCLG